MFRSKRLLLAVTAALIVISVSVYALALRPKEATYNGKPVSTWFKEYVALRDDMAKSPAATTNNLQAIETYQAVFRNLGSNSIVYLQEVMEAKGSIMVRLYSLLLEIVPGLSNVLPNPSHNLEEKLQAAELLLNLQRDPASGFRDIIQRLPQGSDSRVVMTFIQLLNASADPEKVPPSQTPKEKDKN